jgi:S-formylglutathione hydrolase FrmB
MQRLSFPAACTPRADGLLVFLPGAYDRPADLAEQGFAQAVRDRSLALDVWLVDAHLGYYNERSIVERLHAEVIAPARAQGYRTIWLAGISIGGFGSLLYAKTHPREVQGVIALAPYLGARSLLKEIDAAGGAAAWLASGAAERVDSPDAAERSLWRWLTTVGSQPAPADAPELILGFGTEDRLVAGHRLLAAVMLPAKVLTTPGGHDWPAWRTLWARMLDDPPAGLRTRCDPPTGR